MRDSYLPYNLLLLYLSIGVFLRAFKGVFLLGVAL